MNFDNFICPCNHHPKQNAKHFHYHLIFLHVPFWADPAITGPHIWNQQFSDICLCRLVLHVPELHKIIGYTFFTSDFSCSTSKLLFEWKVCPFQLLRSILLNQYNIYFSYFHLLMDIWVVSSFCYYEWSCEECSCINLLVNTCLHFSWIST